MKVLSLDLRERIVASYDEGKSTREEISKRYQVSLGMVKKLLQQRRKTGSLGARYDRCGRKPLILVVEDHDSARTALTKLLTSTGYDVVEAPNGSDALAQLATGPRPDLILLDLMMPVMDGWEFLRRQRFDWHLCTIPTIVVSGVASHDPRCLEMPIVRLLPKPYTVDQLVAAIDAEISTRQAPDPPIMLRATPRPAPVPLRRIRI